MPDVEAVIKALRCSANDATHCFDSSCCYHEPGHACNKSKLMLDAITLLEKQQKKKERLLPCKCGCMRREHWYGNGETLKCKRCGFAVKGKNEADAIREWNKAVSSNSDIMSVESGLWNDDITFCSEKCGWMCCPRNSKNIRDRTVPHSFSIEIPQDCPKK